MAMLVVMCTGHVVCRNTLYSHSVNISIEILSNLCIHPLFYGVHFSLFSAFYTSEHRNLDLTIPALGEILAVKFLSDGNWYRGKCVEADPDNEQVKVIH